MVKQTALSDQQSDRGQLDRPTIGDGAGDMCQTPTDGGRQPDHRQHDHRPARAPGRRAALFAIEPTVQPADQPADEGNRVRNHAEKRPELPEYGVHHKRRKQDGRD